MDRLGNQQMVIEFALLTLSWEKSLRMQEILILFHWSILKQLPKSGQVLVRLPMHKVLLVTNVRNKRSAAKEIAEQETKEKKVVRGKEEERNSVIIQYICKAFQHDHGSYCSRSNNSTQASVIASPCSLYLQLSRSGEEGAICVPTISCNIFRMSD